MNTNRTTAFEELKEFLVPEKNENSAWIGDSLSPLSGTELVLDLSTNMRLDPSHHGKYKTVWIYSKSIFEYFDSWKIILDETIRTIDEEGNLIVRSIDSEFGTLFDLKSQLFRNKNLSTTLIKQIKINDSELISIFHIKRLAPSLYRDKSWSIGILSNGQKEDLIIRLINSLSDANTNHIPLEFIIAGPYLKSVVSDDINIKYVIPDIDDNLPRISEKKNKIILNANNSNIAIFHDRYICDKNYFEGFEQFGYDFDYLTIRQSYESGLEFPSYLSFKNK